jgi:hypothetical protein
MDHPAPMVLHEHDVDAKSWNDATRGTPTFHALFGGPASRPERFTTGVADRLFYTLAADSFDEVEFVLDGQVHGGRGFPGAAELSRTEQRRATGGEPARSMPSPGRGGAC